MSEDRKELPRKDDGTLVRYAFPGGYEVLYLDRENSVLCADCANESEANRDDWPDEVPVASEVLYASDWNCDVCGYRHRKDD